MCMCVELQGNVIHVPVHVWQVLRLFRFFRFLTCMIRYHVKRLFRYRSMHTNFTAWFFFLICLLRCARVTRDCRVDRPNVARYNTRLLCIIVYIYLYKFFIYIYISNLFAFILFFNRTTVCVNFSFGRGTTRIIPTTRFKWVNWIAVVASKRSERV